MGYQTASAFGFSGFDPLGTAFSNHFDREAERRQYAYAQKLAEQQFGYSKELMQMQQDFDASQSALAFDKSMQAFARRYQTTVGDLRRAGINPLLAVNGLVGNSPTAGAASSSLPSVGLPTVAPQNTTGSSGGFDANAFASSKQALKSAKASADRVVAEAENAKKTGSLIDAQVAKTLSDIEYNKASTDNKIIDTEKKGNESTKTKVDTWVDPIYPISKAAQVTTSAYVGKKVHDIYVLSKANPQVAKRAVNAVEELPLKNVNSAKSAKSLWPVMKGILSFGLPSGVAGVGMTEAEIREHKKGMRDKDYARERARRNDALMNALH